MVIDMEGTMTRVGKVNQDLIPNAVYCGGKGDEALWERCGIRLSFRKDSRLEESGVKI